MYPQQDSPNPLSYMTHSGVEMADKYFKLLSFPGDVEFVWCVVRNVNFIY